MVTVPAIISILKSGASTFFGWFLKYPREMIILLLGAYIIFCQWTHNGPINVNGPCPGPELGDTLSMVHDTTYIYPDTNLILKLHGFDLIPEEVEKSKNPKWVAPEIVIDSGASTADSLTEILWAVDFLEKELYDCDSTYREETAKRTYKDTLHADSIDVFLELKVKGAVIDTPKFTYRRTKPLMQITTMIERAVLIGPFRKIGIGAEVGHHFKQGNALMGMEAAVNLNYLDKKNNAFKVEGGYLFQQNPGWSIKVGYTKYFNIKT
jgi:hypothetical protein